MNKKTLASEARHRITIQGTTLTPDGEGGFTEGWSDLSTVWAKITAVQARQQYQFNSVGVEATHRIEVRGSVVVSELNRIKFGTRYFEVKTIEDIEERGIVKVITCREVR
jgi:SPP1 family predicted phage head-tail adaptor